MRVGDVVVVRAGEVVPVDGTLQNASALLDESALTGEPLPVAHACGQDLRSGIANAGVAFQVGDAPFGGAEHLRRGCPSRPAGGVAARALSANGHRYAGLLLPLTLLLVTLGWLVSGDAVRALAGLVVATPCPLILAAPVALVSGVSRAARRGVIVKGAEVIEALGSVRTVLFDKTAGPPVIAMVVPFGAYDEMQVLRRAASLDQLSVHPIAEAIVRHTQAIGVALATPTDVHEEPGRGIRVASTVASWSSGNRSGLPAAIAKMRSPCSTAG